MVADLIDGEPGVRRPGAAERMEAHADPDVKRFLDQHRLVALDEAGVTKSKVKGSTRPKLTGLPSSLTWRGPDHPGRWR
jgi:hypothetical protein